MTHPLESFILSYLDAEEIPWEEVESKVYDALLPNELNSILTYGKNNDLVRLCFDPEALCEHPNSRLLALGDPSLDDLFQKVVTAGRSAHIFLSESSWVLKKLETSIQHAITLPPNYTLSFGTPRPLYFSKALFYFQITNLSDEKQQALLSIGVDLHFGRMVRHLEMLIHSSEIFPSRQLPYPNASSISREEGYHIAWNECYGKAKASTALLKQKQQNIFTKESQRLKSYFNELRKELLARKEKAESKQEDLSRFSKQLQAIDLEEKARIADLQKKSILQTEIRLMNVLWIEQLQVLTPISLLYANNSTDLEIVWDPKTHRVEPLVCPTCQVPTLNLITFDRGRIGCPQCRKTSKS